MPTYYIAWVNEGVTFSVGTHATAATKIWDGAEGGEHVFSVEIEHNEGEFPSLIAELINAGIGLLAAGQNRWVWLSWDNGAGVEPLFNGRLIGVPQRMIGEVIRVEFVARPADFVAQKEAVAESLRELPWFDRAFLQERLDDADTVLETRTARWHIGRTDLVVSASDIVAGEDGTIEVGADDHFYDDFDVSYAETPKRRGRLTMTVKWAQRGSGEVDLTRELHAKFQAAGSPFGYPVVASMSGDGLLADWPTPESDIGGGWGVGAGTAIEPATWIEEKAYVVQYVDRGEEDGAAVSLYQVPGQDLAATAIAEWTNWEAAFPLGAYKVGFVAHYDAERERSETVTLTLEAAVQDLLVEPGADEEFTIELTSDVIGEPVDPDEGSPGAFDLPIGDLRRNTYFKTARGGQSIEYGLLLLRAHLITAARAVRIEFATTWAVAAAISCRKSVHLTDRRLPGGEATGKVVSYTLAASGDRDFSARVTIASTIGYGVALPAAAAGIGVYVEDGVIEDGTQQRLGGQETIIAGELLYESLDNFEITDDDGLNLLDMTARTVVNSIAIAGGPDDQRAAIDAALESVVPDPVGALRDLPTVVTLDLKPVAGGAFHVDFAPDVSELVIPQTIDLEAAA